MLKIKARQQSDIIILHQVVHYQWNNKGQHHALIRNLFSIAATHVKKMTMRNLKHTLKR